MKSLTAEKEPVPNHVRGAVKKPVKRQYGSKDNSGVPDLICSHYPFPKVFDYIECETYQETFKSTSRKNDVVPTKDFQYSDALNINSITDMELL